MTQDRPSPDTHKQKELTPAKIGLISAVAVAIISLAATIISAYISSQAAQVPVIIPLQATQTAEATLLLTETTRFATSAQSTAPTDGAATTDFPTITATPTETPKPLRNTPTSTPTPPPPNCNPDMIITSPRPGEIVNGKVPIVGTARHPDFAFYKVEYGVGESPSSFIAVSRIVEQEVDDDVLDIWRTDRDVIRNGTYILKLTVVRTDGNEAQPTCSIKVIVQK